MRYDWKLDAIKGIAIICVLIQHSMMDFEIPKFWYFTICQAVPVFMLISGYVYTLSYESMQLTKLSEFYKKDLMLKRLSRLYIPFFLALAMILIVKHIYQPSAIFTTLANANYGCGGYYPYVMFQFIFIIPLLYLLVKKLNGKHIIALFLLCVLIEWIIQYTGMTELQYMIFIERYLFAIILGCYLALNKIDKRYIYAGVPLSVLYIYFTCYFNYRFFGHAYHLPYQAPSYFYTAFLFIALLWILSFVRESYMSILIRLGKASWHIFLFQMLYYNLYAWRFYDAGFIIRNVAICCIFGYLFYRVDDFSLYKSKTVKQ